MPPPNWRRAPDCNGTQRALHVPLALQHIQALASFFLLRLADHIVVQVPEYVVGYCESINGRLKDELLNGEIFYTLKEAQIIIEEWRIHYNTKRPHSALGYRPPAPEAIIPMDPRLVMH